MESIIRKITQDQIKILNKIIMDQIHTSNFIKKNDTHIIIHKILIIYTINL